MAITGSGISAGSRFSPNFRIFPSLSKKLWIAGSLHREGRRSPDAPQGWEAGFSKSSGFPALPCNSPNSESSLASQRSCGVPSQRRMTKPRRPARVFGAGFPRSRRAGFPRHNQTAESGIVRRRTYRERNFRPGSRKQFQDSPSLSRKLWIIHREVQMPRKGSASGFQQVTGLRGAGFPARVTGERDFRPGARFPRISETVDRWVPSRRRTTKLGGKRVSVRQRDSFAGVTGSGIFDRVPRRGYWGAEFSLRGRGKRVFPSSGREAGFFPNFQTTPCEGREVGPASHRHFPLPGIGIPPPGSPESGIFAEAGFSELLGSGICRLRKVPLAGGGFPHQIHRGAGFSTRSFGGGFQGE